jgi:hypothetical protein
MQIVFQISPLFLQRIAEFKAGHAPLSSLYLPTQCLDVGVLGEERGEGHSGGGEATLAVTGFDNNQLNVSSGTNDDAWRADDVQVLPILAIFFFFFNMCLFC